MNKLYVLAAGFSLALVGLKCRLALPCTAPPLTRAMSETGLPRPLGVASVGEARVAANRSPFFPGREVDALSREVAHGGVRSPGGASINVETPAEAERTERAAARKPKVERAHTFWKEAAGNTEWHHVRRPAARLHSEAGR